MKIFELNGAASTTYKMAYTPQWLGIITPNTITGMQIRVTKEELGVICNIELDGLKLIANANTMTSLGATDIRYIALATGELSGSCTVTISQQGTGLTEVFANSVNDGLLPIVTLIDTAVVNQATPYEKFSKLYVQSPDDNDLIIFQGIDGVTNNITVREFKGFLDMSKNNSADVMCIDNTDQSIKVLQYQPVNTSRTIYVQRLLINSSFASAKAKEKVIKNAPALLGKITNKPVTNKK